MTIYGQCIHRNYHLLNAAYELRVCCVSFVHPYLVFAALTQLQAGKNLALNGLHPGVPLVHTLGFKMPRLASARHNEEVKIILI